MLEKYLDQLRINLLDQGKDFYPTGVEIHWYCEPNFYCIKSPRCRVPITMFKTKVIQNILSLNNYGKSSGLSLETALGLKDLTKCRNQGRQIVMSGDGKWPRSLDNSLSNVNWQHIAHVPSYSFLEV